MATHTSKKPTGHFCTILAAAAVIATVTLLVHAELQAGDNPKRVQARRITQPPHIDGFLKEEVWSLADSISDFLQRNPEEGAPPSEKTTIRVLYDDDAVYFGCMMYDSEPEKIVHRLARRDDEVESDYISIRIDSFHDHQTGFEFTINASGTKVDILQYNDANNEDESWDVVWDVSTQLLSNGWSAEVRIPFHALRFSAGGQQTWGINFLRTISRKKETDYWALVGKNESGFISRFGHLVGIEITEPPRRLEFLPYGVGNAEYQQISPAHPPGSDYKGNAGFDLKYGITSNLTLDLTVNPDFGQVEADPSVLNLTTFETFYPEKRPFFIEGAQILRFTTFGGALGPGLFYSRRIGRALRGEASAPSGGYVLNEPNSATILGAAKLSGKTPSGLAIGMLQALTQRETAILVDSLGNRTSQGVEPFAHYSVLRLRQDTWENSNVGGIFTSAVKENRRPAFVLGFDWDLKFQQNTYVLDGFVAASHTTNRLDERITGSAGKFELQKVAGKHWLWNTSVDYTTKKYNANDVGFFVSPNDFGSVGELRYREETPGEIFRRYIFGLGYHVRMNFDGANIFRAINWFGRLQFLNYWQVVHQGNYDTGLYDQFESRGHGLYRRPKPYQLTFGIESDPRLPVTGEFNLGYSGDETGSHGFSAQLKTVIRPLTWIDISFSLNINPIRNREAWFTNVVDQTDTSRTIALFGDRDTDKLDFTLRSSITFARDLTLQIYAQVFLAKGHYENVRQLIGPNEFSPFAYASNPDFNRKSFNTNVVLRWEYLPGSTLYLVWSQARQGLGDDYFTSLSSNFRDTFKAPSDNVLLLKLSYWWSL